MKSLKYLMLFFTLCCFSLNGKAQKSINDSTISMGIASLAYAPTIPGGNLVDRFGLYNYIGPELGYKFKNNVYVYTASRFMFGTQVKERTATNVTFLQQDTTGVYTVMAVGTDGRNYEVRFFQRGLVIPLMVGKIFPLSKKANPNSGLYVEAGAQFFRHKIRIEVPGENVPFLSPDLKKGYDRLTYGMGIAEGIGYRYISKSRMINIYGGIDLSQNFTKGRRTINYDTGLVDDQPRTDLAFGVKIGWSFLIYQAAPDDFYIY